MADKLKTSKFVKLKGCPVAPDGEKLYVCDNCGRLWRTKDVKPAENLYERISDGDPMSSQECPKCGALAFPAEGEPAEIILGLYSTQVKILKGHDGHDVQIRVLKGKVVLLCETCGNMGTHVVDEEKIAKP